MTSCFSISLSCNGNDVVSQICRWLCLPWSYIHNLSDNIDSLQKAMGVLNSKRVDVESWAQREEFTGSQRRLARVTEWLNSVMSIENRVSDLLSTNTVELQRLCLCNVCSKDLKESYCYGKRVIMMLKEVENLDTQGNFNVVTEAVPISEVQVLRIQSIIVGQETLFERVWNHLMEDGVGVVGLYGLGGVGKTTLLKQINNKFSEIVGSFHVVLWVVVSSSTTIHKVQGDIAQKLGLEGDEWDQKNENQRAIDIHNVLRRHKFVLLLDDLWENVDLEAIGVPNPTRENKCKIAFTTRSTEVCYSMGVHNPMEVSCLDPNKAWNLFQKKVGVNRLESHPDIPELARTIAHKCRGLPLALNIIGETMSLKSTIHEWRDAVDVLTSSAAEFSGMENKILPILKYSYDNLNGKLVKSCFLYCSLFPEDDQIRKERLIEYWICEGFIDETEGREKAINQGYKILGTLIRVSLLLDTAIDKSTVSMHDVVREMALWISSDLGKHKDQCFVQPNMGLIEVPKVKNWRVLKMMSLMGNKIKNIIDTPECPQLTTLLLHKNSKLVNISGEFFQSMPILLVLDLSENKKLRELPEEVSKLVSLRYLDLSHTKIERLPLGLQKLEMLIHLNLEHTKRLESLNGISNLLSLRIFRLRYSRMMLDMSLIKELELLKHLEFISVNIWWSVIGEKWFYDSNVGRCVQDVFIHKRGIKPLSIVVFPAMVNLRDVYIEFSDMSEIMIEKTIWNKTSTNPCFSNLSSLYLKQCYGLKDLTWLLFAPNFTYLFVLTSTQLVTIFSKEKALEEEACNIIPFRKLEVLRLFSLPLLNSIHWASLPFTCLTKIEIYNCPNLKKLSLDSQSVHKIEEFTINYRGEEWKEGIEWEDEATKSRFLQSLKSF